MTVRSYDAIIAGAGIIGTALALRLAQRGVKTLLLDRGEPGHEASYASAGLLAASEIDTPSALSEFAQLSARLYPEFVHELQGRSGERIDFRTNGAISFGEPGAAPALTSEKLNELEPTVEYRGEPAYFVDENYVDPRTLIAAALKAARAAGVEVHHDSRVTAINANGLKVIGVQTERSNFAAPIVVNCCGAWAAQLPGAAVPTKPVKGHLISLLHAHGPPIQRVVRSRALDTYMLPRSSGLVVAGSTLEDAGFDKSVDPEIALRIHQTAAILVPALGEAKIHQAWTGLRPGSPDDLPILGRGDLEGSFIATGHFRNGMLLAPVTALVMSQLILDEPLALDLAPFSPARFANIPARPQ